MATSKMQPVTIDFETEPIRSYPCYPPKPVGVSIKYAGEGAHYYAFGHPTHNNCSESQAVKALRKAWSHSGGILCHNIKFDYLVARVHLGMAELDWSKLHDTLYLLFLNNPHAEQLALKPSAAKLLGMPPEEQDAVRDWLITNQDALRSDGLLPADVKLSFSYKAKDSPSGEPQCWAAWICLAPGDLVGAYADGDVIRAEKLFDLLMPDIQKRGMQDAYNRERKLIPILLHIEQQGIRVELDRLWNDVLAYEDTLVQIDRWLRNRIDVGNDFNFKSGQRLVHVLADKGLLELDKLGLTPKSKIEKPTYKSDKESLGCAISDPQLAGILQYQSQLETCLGTFMKPWLTTAMRSSGLIFTQWNQVRTDEFGARTGRFSSSPNFQNIPLEFKPIFQHEIKLAEDTDEGVRAKMLALKKSLPISPLRLPPLPMCRSYVAPIKDGDILIDRDFSGQEPRIFGHFENGPLLDAYKEDPWLDLHDHATAIINTRLNTSFPRKAVKQIILGLLYGMGIPLLARKSGVTETEARTLKKAMLQIFPGLDEINKDMKTRARNNLPIRTWGGREYHCEPPKMFNGKVITFDYKMINVLIQGSAADCTKDALIDYWSRKEPDVDLLLTVHDEILISAPAGIAHIAMETLRVAMESISFDVEMKSEGTMSETNWGCMKPYDKKGARV